MCREEQQMLILLEMTLTAVAFTDITGFSLDRIAQLPKFHEIENYCWPYFVIQRIGRRHSAEANILTSEY